MMNSQKRPIPAERAEMQTAGHGAAPVLPLTVVSHKQHDWLVVDATGRAVSQVYWVKERAEAAMDRLIRAARKITRPCLCCRASFVSEGPHNRMCASCRSSASDPYQSVRPYIVRGA